MSSANSTRFCLDLNMITEDLVIDIQELETDVLFKYWNSLDQLFCFEIFTYNLMTMNSDGLIVNRSHGIQSQ